MAAITLKTTDTQKIFIANIVDASGAVVTGVSGYGFVWAADDNGALFSHLGPNGNLCAAALSGAAGTVNLSCTATKPGSPTLTGSSQITIAGPVGVGLDIELQP